MRRGLPALWTMGVFMAAIAQPGAATMVKRMALDGVTHDAARIVHGTVVDVSSGRDESGLPATWTTLAIAETLKGPANRRLTIKQYGVAAPLADGTLTRIPGLPRYAVGEEVVLFLHPDSRRGFTSPVGLGQGCYRITRSGARRLARRDSSRRTHNLDELLATVRQLTASER